MKSQEKMLREAATKLCEHGWTRYYAPPQGRESICILEALAIVQNRAHWTDASVPLTLYDVITHPEDPFPHSTAALISLVFNFNDYHCKTRDDAIAALEIAADLAA